MLNGEIRVFAMRVAAELNVHSRMSVECFVVDFLFIKKNKRNFLEISYARSYVTLERS